MAKIWDCCIFFNELDMLETRFHILDPVVDHFLVCEAPITHAGQPKSMIFHDHADRFRPWWDKIVYVDSGPIRLQNSWDREREHRRRISYGLTLAAQPDDWVIVGDVDEIPAPHAVQELHNVREMDSVQFELDFYYYDLNHRVRQGWAIGARRWMEGLHDPNDIRTCKGRRSLTAYSAGWHFSYFNGPEAIIAKVDAFMHHADPIIRDLPRDAAFIASKIAASQDLYGRDLQIDEVLLEDTLPAYILDHPDHYRALGWIR